MKRDKRGRFIKSKSKGGGKSARAWIKEHYKESNQYNPRDINTISISILSNAKKAKVKVTRQDILSWWGKRSKRYLKSYPFKKSRR